jgi:hypothetical protein
MFDWLLDHKFTAYFVLAAGLVASLAFWWRSRNRRLIGVAAACAVLLLCVFVLDRAIETDGEQMSRKVQAVAAAVTANEMDAVFQHVSESFDRGGVDKKRFREFCTSERSRGQITEVQVWNLTPQDVSRPNRTAAVRFNFKARGNGGESPSNWDAKVTFTLDPDGQWRVKTFDVYDMLNQSNTPIPIPHWGGR